ncbi:hypothetical protein DH2020_024320 [Rehmannia glutinosa]|uniref:Beta-galactosidase n=1 Tax=Rehmannia glutinosa TaxID=99300 RepID=A0ABR0W2V5_REHGL
MGSGTVALVFLLSVAAASVCFAVNVTYDGRALVVDGKRRVLVSGSIHYPRSTPEMWPDLIKKSKDGGLDIIETYVFWNLHEPNRGQFDFSGRKDLVKFIKLVGEAGLFVHLRIGPYVCAEWNYGGFPLWLHFLPGIQLRTDNAPYKIEMQRFTARIVALMKQNNLFASQGGPIILSQIENEYGNVESEYGSSAKPYIDWAAQMATSMNTGVPWVMCQQDDAPDPMINTCNGFYCDQFTPNSDQKPKFWTELWSGWFSSFGDPVPYRPAEDVAFAAARFYQKNGTLLNYYMYHGGTNFGRTSGGPFFTTSYDYDAPLDEFGLLRQPKWGHLKDLHKAIKLCEEAMVAAVGNTTSLGQNSEATVYQTESGQCAAFLANWDGQLDSIVYFNGNYYDLPAWSVSILPDCKNVVYNTAKVNSITAIPKFVPQASQTGPNSSVASFSSWSWFKEPVGISINRDAFVLPGLVEQINTTADKSDFMWYSLSDPLLRDGSQIQLHVESLGHVLYAFVNGRLAGKGSGKGKGISVDIPVNLEPGNNTIDLLSLTMGLQNYGAFFDLAGAGITGPVQFKGLNNGSTVDLSSEQWTYQVGLKGERVRLPQGISKVWASQPALPINTPLTWYKTTFSAPPGNSPVAIDFTGMGKGQAWINGQSIGRYWPANISPASGNCVDSCNYRGQYDQKKCLRGCGKPAQQHYHIPRSWLKPTGNILVMLEEIGGNPNNISFATREIGLICARVSESYPAPLDLWSDNYLTRVTKPTLLLECPFPNQVITDLPFISFGNPHGTCGSFTHGRCRSRQARRIVRKACLGKPKCSIEVTVDNLGEPCANVTKSLAVAAYCS